MNKQSRFYIKDKRTLKQKLSDFGQSMLFWRSRKKVMITTRNITWDDIRSIFFPKDFCEKYHYLGSVPWTGTNDIFKAMEPLVIFMDYKAKPWWCPRWFLRFLYLFGMDNSIVRVRNRTLSNLLQKITKGYLIFDYKTKWQNYDLRISVSGDKQMQDLANAIERRFYEDGYREDLADKVKELDPNTLLNKGNTISRLKEELIKLGHEEY